MFPGVFRERVGFQFPQKQQTEPCGLVERRAEGGRPVEQVPAIAQRVLGMDPLFLDVESPVQQQQAVYGPFDDLLVVDGSLCNGGTPPDEGLSA